MGPETQEQTLHVDKEQYINWTGERMRCSDTSKCARVFAMKFKVYIYDH